MSLSTNVANLATRIATEIKSLRVLINGNAADLNALNTTVKSNLVLAINEVNSKPSSAPIDDTTPRTTTLYSSQRTEDRITQRYNELTAGAPDALNTLDELAAALGDDANFAASTTSALSNRVRVDAVQTFSAPQQAQGRSNIDAASATDVGPTNTNYVGVFEAGLV